MTMTLESIRNLLERGYIDAYDDPAQVRASIDAAIRERDELRFRTQAINATTYQDALAVGRAEKAEAELAALKARIAEAPMAVVQSAPGAIKASFHGYGCFEYTAENLQPKLRGKRVRLVVEE